MYKLRLLHNPLQEYSKYRDEAIMHLDDYIKCNKLKEKHYKNGNIDIWFSKSAYKYGKYLIDRLSIESIAYNVRKLK